MEVMFEGEGRFGTQSAKLSYRSFGERVAMNSPIQGTAARYHQDCVIPGGSEARKEASPVTITQNFDEATD